MNINLNRLMGCSHCSVSVLVGRTNWIPKRPFAASLRENEDWLYTIPFLEFDHNISVHSSTGKTPYEMMHGRKPPVPEELSLDN